MNSPQFNINHDSPASIRAFLDSRDLAPRKRWGQNFLINKGAREKIIGLLDVHSGQDTWEIGPGLGAMSGMLLDRGARLTAFEIDPAYRDWLVEAFGDRDFRVVFGDVLKTWNDQWNSGVPRRVLGNLPYNAASAIIAAFVESRRIPDKMVFTVQEEMGYRMTASPSMKSYSSFSVLCQSSARVIDGGRLSPGSFYPAPRVNSRIMTMEPAEPYGPIADFPLFQLVLRSLFASRRKTLGNNLNAAVSRPGFPRKEDVQQAFLDMKIDPRRRPETLAPEEWIGLTNLLSSSSP